jgi:succinate dehydrogenase / fumarate reductase flavoprotein subunit
MLAVSECIARAALERRESRGGHTREDYPKTDPEQAKFNVVARQQGEDVALVREPRPPMPDELRSLLEAS